MGRALRSGTQLPSPRLKKTKKQTPSRVPEQTPQLTAKRRIISIDDDYAPTSPERLFYPPTDPTYRPGRIPSEASLPSPVKPKTTSRVNKTKPKKPKKPAAALRAALDYAGPARAAGSEPEAIVKRRSSSMKSMASPSSSIEASPSKKVSFDEAQDEVDSVSDDDEYEQPFTSIFNIQNTTRFPTRTITPATPAERRRSTPPLNTGKSTSAKLQAPLTPPESPTRKPFRDEALIMPEPIDWIRMDKDAHELLEDLIQAPRMISLNDISACFHHIQLRSRIWAQKHFKVDILTDEDAQDAWPLHLLKTKYRPLFLTTQYIADGSQYGWRRFFTNADSRWCLVNGIVGEYVKQHVFGHTAFGCTKEENVELEKADKRLIHEDGFLRNKTRANMMKDFFDSKTGRERIGELHAQINHLVESILMIIEPLMPPDVFDYDAEKKEWCLVDDADALEKRTMIGSELFDIVEKCVALHWAIRLRGEDGTLVRIAPHVQKGEQFHETAPFVCLNETMMQETAHHGGNEKERVKKIKLTCWGRVEAYAPHGKDHDELAEIEQKYRETHGMLKKEDVREDDADADEDEDIKQRDVMTEDDDDFWDNVDKWYYTYHKEHVRPEPPEQVKKYEMRKHGKKEHEMRNFRTPYVTSHKFMSLHDVYCEWEPTDKPEFNFNSKIQEVEEPVSPKGATPKQWLADEKYGLPLPKSERLSLYEAVEQARKERHVWKHRMEDTHISVRNHLNRHWWKYESTALIFAATLFVKSARGLTWEEMCAMPPARLRNLMKPYLGKLLRGAKTVGHHMRKLASLMTDGFCELSDAVYDLIKRMQQQGIVDGWLSYWHAKAATKHPFFRWLMSLLPGRGSAKKTVAVPAP